jgi:hypothetical protein
VHGRLRVNERVIVLLLAISTQGCVLKREGHLESLYQAEA